MEEDRKDVRYPSGNALEKTRVEGYKIIIMITKLASNTELLYLVRNGSFLTPRP